MGDRGRCVSCGTTLPTGQAAGYCEACSATWQANAEPEQGATQCANCGAALPADQPAGHAYCEKCAASWQRGKK